MSAPIADEVLRELGAEHRQFRSVRHALEWYIEQKHHATDLSISMEAGSPMNFAKLNETRVTKAKLDYCLQARNPEIDDHVLQHADRILEWNLGYTDTETLARKWGLDGPGKVHSVMGHAESVLSKRMRARGLLGGG